MTAEGKLDSVSVLPLPSSRFHSAQHSVLALSPSICAQGLSVLSLLPITLCNLCFQLVLRKSLFDSHTPTQPPSQPFSFPHSPPPCLTTFIVHLLSHLHLFRFLVTRNSSCKRAVQENPIVKNKRPGCQSRLQ